MISNQGCALLVVEESHQYSFSKFIKKPEHSPLPVYIKHHRQLIITILTNNLTNIYK